MEGKLNEGKVGSPYFDLRLGAEYLKRNKFEKDYEMQSW